MKIEDKQEKPLEDTKKEKTLDEIAAEMIISGMVAVPPPLTCTQRQKTSLCMQKLTKYCL